jgi:hypothetical protein
MRQRLLMFFKPNPSRMSTWPPHSGQRLKYSAMLNGGPDIRTTPPRRRKHSTEPAIVELAALDRIVM